MARTQMHKNIGTLISSCQEQKQIGASLQNKIWIEPE